MVEDLHQPLHAAALYSELFPSGDLGGNLFKVSYLDSKIRNLHQLWDSCLDQYGSIGAPVNEAEYAYLTQVVSSLCLIFRGPKSAKESRSLMRIFGLVKAMK
mmetsp:Transcript_28479/g.32571  ORF Transcript_28479/g.32571 Transcript_28479/m.32571 type:complete len:102 (-) Transcript_28479:132-437(-)